MRSKFSHAAHLALLAVLIAAAPGDAAAQADYAEGFEDAGPNNGLPGPSNLIAQGWIFRDQSQFNSSTTAWHDGYTMWWGGPVPYEGTGFLGAHPKGTHQGQVSLWAILPPIPGQIAGDVATVHVQDESPLMTKWVELRYSPSGGTSTGTGSSAVGDFTTLLGVVHLTSGTGWRELTGDLPGDGRIALRYGGYYDWTAGEMYTAIDSLTVGPPPQQPCNLPVFPQEGQTVTWTAAGGPYEICLDRVVPAGSTVIVEPGTVIDVQPGRSIFVDGKLIAQGTPSQPIVIHGSPEEWALHAGVDGLHAPSFGDIELAFVQTTGAVLGGVGSTIVTDSSFLDGAGLWVDKGLPIDPLPHMYVQVERSSFQGSGFKSGLSADAATVVLRESTFEDCGVAVSGYYWGHDVAIQGGSLAVRREWPGQSVFINSITVHDNTDGAALVLADGNYLVGEASLVNNLYPLRLQGGLLAGSNLPAAGNFNDHIYAPNGFYTSYLQARGRIEWHDAGIPYVVQGNDIPAFDFTIREGVDVRFMPFSGWFFVGDDYLYIRGLPDNPVTLGGLHGQPWERIRWKSSEARLDHVEIRDAKMALLLDGAFITLQNVLLEGNEIASRNLGGILTVIGSRFFGNGVGIDGWSSRIFGETNPSWFEGNGNAVNASQGFHEAPDNYWGHPTGPTSFANPGGQGDPVSGNIDFTPFLTAPPDVSDHPPVVRAKETSFLHYVGRPMLLAWDAFDDGEIVKFEVMLHGPGLFEGFVVVDELPPLQRTYEYIPAAPGQFDDPGVVRIVAIDDKGQRGYDEFAFHVQAAPGQHIQAIHEASYTAGEEIDSCYSGGMPTESWLVIEDSWHYIPLGGSTTPCLAIGLEVPYVSTDLVRFATWSGTWEGSDWHLSDYFTIRPDARVGDAPPAITLLSPVPGAEFAGGSVVPIAWIASDPEGLRSFSIHSSLDGGLTWNVVQTDLLPSATSYDLVLPPSAGVSDARIRVIAHDLHFQATSDGGSTSFTILEGGEAGAMDAVPYCFGDGSGAPCPCGNSGGLGAGCANSLGTSGVLGASGSTSVSAGNLVLSAAGLTPNPGLYFQGDQHVAGGAGVTFGDGLRCAGVGVVRLQVLQTDATGKSSTTIDVAAAGGVQAGQTRYYQLWYRDPLTSPCSTGFNLTNGLRVRWTP